MNGHSQFEIRDLDSTNLTIVNGHDVASHVLQYGDLILLGDTEVKVEIESSDDVMNEKTTRDLNILPKDTDNSSN